MTFAISSNEIASEAEYRAAVEEFDALWCSGPSNARQARMDKLIPLIEAFELRRAPITTQALVCQD